MQIHRTNKKGSIASEKRARMDAALWCNLPDELLEQILAWLPFDALFRTRTVCRRWNALISCPSFLEHCSRLPPKGPLFAWTGFGQLCMLFPDSGRWLKLPLVAAAADLRPMAAAGGLVAFTSCYCTADEAYTYTVCNPLTGACKKLPRPPFQPRTVARVAMVAGSSSGYKLLVLTAGGATVVFDSADWSWTCLPGGEEVSGSVAVCGGVLYCLTPSWYHCSLLSFNVEAGRWMKIRTGRLPGYCQFRTLVELNDGILAIVGKCMRDKANTVCVWVLCLRTLKWKEVARMPKPMAETFLEHTSDKLNCSGLAGLVLITRETSHSAVLFHAASSSWTWVSHCFTAPSCFAFQPKLNALP